MVLQTPVKLSTVECQSKKHFLISNTQNKFQNFSEFIIEKFSSYKKKIKLSASSRSENMAHLYNPLNASSIRLYDSFNCCKNI